MSTQIWREKFDIYEVLTDWEKYKNPEKPKHKLNEYRLIKIDFTIYLEVKTQKPEITFLLDKENFDLLKNFTWYFSKIGNIYYIKTYVNKKSTYLHRMIKPEYRMIDHINWQGCDNREYNLRETTYSQNNLNRNLQKNNTSGYNEICFYKTKKAWIFR